MDPRGSGRSTAPQQSLLRAAGPRPQLRALDRRSRPRPAAVLDPRVVVKDIHVLANTFTVRRSSYRLRGGPALRGAQDPPQPAQATIPDRGAARTCPAAA